MNNDRRKQLNKVPGMLEGATAVVQDVLDAEQEAYDNMPEGLQQSERGEQSQAAIQALESALYSLGEVQEFIEEATE